MIWKEPHRGEEPAAGAVGAQRDRAVEAMIDGRAPAPPIHYLTGMHPTAVGPDTSEFVMPATGWLASPSGFILGGVLAMLADGPLGCAIQAGLPPGTGYTTAELSMSYLRPGVPDGRTLTARGRAVHAGRSLALSEVLVTDADGRDLAQARRDGGWLVDHPPRPRHDRSDRADRAPALAQCQRYGFFGPRSSDSVACERVTSASIASARWTRSML